VRMLEVGMPDGSAFLSDPFLKISEVEKEVGLGRSTIYRHMAKGLFPQPRQLGGGLVRWPRSVILEWKDSLPVRQVSVPPAGEEVAGRRRA